MSGRRLLEIAAREELGHGEPGDDRRADAGNDATISGEGIGEQDHDEGNHNEHHVRLQHKVNFSPARHPSVREQGDDE